MGVMPMITTVNRKGQVTIPKSLRNRYGFSPGAKVVWLERDADLIPKPLLSVEQLRGRFKREELTAMLLEERARDRTRMADRVALQTRSSPATRSFGWPRSSG